jgi:hypothetical protein
MAGDGRTMPGDDNHSDSSLTADDEEIGAEIASDTTALHSILSDYR